MTKTKLLEGIKRMRFEELFNQWTENHLTQEEAAKILGIHERTFRRYCRAYEEEGLEGLQDGRVDKQANNGASIDEVFIMQELYRTQYSDFTVAHFFDMYREHHKGERGYTWVKNHLQKIELVKKAKKRGVHRRKRPRSPLPGMMLHQDGSTHEWIPSTHWDLIVTLDDANNEVYSGFFVDEEGTHSSFQGVKEVIEEKGLFCSLYTDRGTHYWNTPTAGGKVDKNNLTQFGRAMQQLGIEMIPAYSPEARGRSERAFRTLQSRLPKEMALAGIVDMNKANQFLKDVYWPKHNTRFSVSLDNKETAFIPWLNNTFSLKDILCVQEQRTVNKDNTISYSGKILQIPKHKDRCHFVKAKIRVHEYADGELSIFHGPRCLARYDTEGQLIEKIF